ncbi:MAG TPA: hypothetical protein PLE78_14965 [Flavobacteriales bacterium]|nr:hypothetical protein [Flavobacteriales bacterium]
MSDMTKNTSKYRGVSAVKAGQGSSARIRFCKNLPWECSVTTPKGRVTKRFATEREAAIYADVLNLEHQLGKPLNILKPRP